METDEPRYTLAEAKRELDRRECQMRGHDWTFRMTLGSQDPFGLICERCGRLLEVVRGG